MFRTKDGLVVTNGELATLSELYEEDVTAAKGWITTKLLDMYYLGVEDGGREGNDR